MNAAKTNHISLSFDAISENEAFARMTAAMFMAQLNPTLDDVSDDSSVRGGDKRNYPWL